MAFIAFRLVQKVEHVGFAHTLPPVASTAAKSY